MQPPRLIRLRTHARAALRQWQRTLPARDRAALRAAHRPDRGIELVGVPADRETERENRAWTQELIEYVNSHEEEGFFLQERRVHICRAHAVARAVVATGVIPARFVCPVRDAACPLAAASARADGVAIHLVSTTSARSAAR